jgi:hypothetical protein
VAPVSTTAQLYIDVMPDLGDGARRVTVDCEWARTTISMLPGDSVVLSDSTLAVACCTAMSLNVGAAVQRSYGSGMRT